MMRRALALVALLAACDPRQNQKDSHPAEKSDKADKDKADKADKPGKDKSDEAPKLGGFGPLAALGMLGRAHEPGPFDDPRESASAEGKPHAAVLELKGTVVELDRPMSFDLFLGGLEDTLPLRTLILRLDTLEADSDVTAILLRFGRLRMSTAAAEELRAALRHLKKPLSCHADGADNLTILLMSACGHITLAPLTEVLFNGPAATPFYLKKLFDLVGVEADFLHVGAFKGAAEPFTRTEPSPEMRQTYDDLLTGIYTRLVKLVAEGRKVDEAKVTAWIDEGLFPAERAKEVGMIDAVEPYESWREARSAGAWKKVKVKDEKSLDLMSILGLGPKKHVSGPHVALLYAVGEVVDGKGSPTTAFTQIAPGRLVPALRAVGADDDVKAVVLRVDSPGGSAQASELIWTEVAALAKKKPVVVSMGGLAASGGYYISVGGSRIFADPDTLTGSIGVVGGKIVIGGALDRIGVHFVEIGKGKRATMLTALRRWTDDERQLMQKMMDDVYATFKARVAQGRHVAPEAVEPNAQGRVFTGAEALTRGLVDELGGLVDALTYARVQGKLAADAPVDVYPPELGLLDMLGALTGDVTTGAVLGSRLEALLLSAAGVELLGPEASTALSGTLRLLAHFADQPIRAVAFVPAIN